MSTLNDVVVAAEAKRQADELAAAADQAWRAAIRVALAGGTRVVDVMAVSGCSRARVYQVRDGRR